MGVICLVGAILGAKVKVGLAEGLIVGLAEGGGIVGAAEGE